MALNVAAFFLLLAIPAVYGATHVVGGNKGWNTGNDYTTWAKGETFKVGDTLVFNYGSLHGVDVVNKNDYDNCNAGNALQTYTGGSTTITLSQSGSMYFMCPTAFHCGQGMKLAIDVNGAGGSSPTPSTPSGSGSTTPSTTPSSYSPNSPSGTNTAPGSFSSTSHLMLSISLVLAALTIRV